MAWNESVEKINNQLEKVREFRYFLLLACLLFFLDSCLIFFYGTPLISFDHKDFLEKSNLGDVLIFFSLFALFLSFIVPVVSFLLFFLYLATPYGVIKFFSPKDPEKIDPKDFFCISQLKYYSVRHGCTVAQNYLQKFEEEERKEKQLEFLSLAFLVSTLLNIYAYLKNSDALFSNFLKIFNDDSFVNSILALILLLLLCSCFYLGVIKSHFTSKDDRIYFPNHPFKNTEKASSSSITER